QNGAQAMRIFAQYRIKPATARWLQNFTPVIFADGCDLIRVQNSALEKIQPSEEFDSMQRKKLLGQIRKPKIESPKTALISDMMDGQHRFERQALRIHEHRHQRRRPIVHVQNL